MDVESTNWSRWGVVVVLDGMLVGIGERTRLDCILGIQLGGLQSVGRVIRRGRSLEERCPLTDDEDDAQEPKLAWVGHRAW